MVSSPNKVPHRAHAFLRNKKVSCWKFSGIFLKRLWWKERRVWLLTVELIFVNLFSERLAMKTQHSLWNWTKGISLKHWIGERYENSNQPFIWLYSRVSLAQFFIAPLFNESATKRELKVIDHEHLRNVQNEIRREIRLMCKTANSKPIPFSKFTTGTSETLKHIQPSNLNNFFLDHYSSNLMTICVIGSGNEWQIFNFDIVILAQYRVFGWYSEGCGIVILSSSKPSSQKTFISGSGFR